MKKALTALIAALMATTAIAGAAAAAKAPKPSAFAIGYMFCSSFSTKDIAMRFGVGATTDSASTAVGRWYTNQIKRDPPRFVYPIRYQATIASGCRAGLQE